MKFIRLLRIVSKLAIYAIVLQSFAFSFLVANDLRGQKVLSVKEATIELESSNGGVIDILKSIESKTDYRFAYDIKDIDRSKKITLSSESYNIAELLLMISKEAGLKFKQINHVINIDKIKGNSQAIEIVLEDISISGKVTDREGNPLPGVTIFIKNTTIGTISDIEGNYSLEVPQESILVFSFVGFVTQEVLITNQSVIDITLSVDSKQLEEVVVVGYGTQEKHEVTGSIVSTSGEELSKSPVPNLGNSLAGRLPGAIVVNRSGEPGADNPDILIRGVSTFSGGNSANQPLIIIDGIPRNSTGLTRLSPSDIESITVLKDASAAIYGSRAANGVILVTTKVGEIGKPTIEFSQNFGISQLTNLIKPLDAPMYASVLNEAEVYEGRTPIYTDAEIEMFRNGTDPLNYPNTDWIAATMKDWTPQNSTNLSVSGGNEKVRYFMSLGRLFQDGIYINGATNYTQYNFRSNLDANITDDLLVSLQLHGRREDRNYNHGGDVVFRNVLKAAPILHGRYPNGLLAPGRRTENPVALATELAGNDKRRDLPFNGTIKFDYKLPFLEGLSVDASFNYDTWTRRESNWGKPFFYYEYDPNTDEYVEKLATAKDAAPNLTEIYRDFVSITANTKIKYDKSFGDHSINAFYGYERNKTEDSFIQARRINFISPAIPQLFAGSEVPADVTNNGTAGRTARINHFGRAMYSFKNRYIVQFIFRYDGSDIFPTVDKRNYGFFPGVTAGWNIGDESFITENFSFVEYLKVRGSWGILGFDGVARDQHRLLYAFNTGGADRDDLNINYVFGSDAAGIKQTITPNPLITWETMESINIGLEGTFIRGLFGFEVDFFKQTRDDILTSRNVSVPNYTGLALPDENIGSVENKGFELQLNHLHEVGDLKYSLGANYSFARNKILFQDEVPRDEEYQLATGHPVGSRLLYVTDGLFRTQEEIDNSPTFTGDNVLPGDIKYVDINDDGLLDSRDLVRQDLNNTPEIIFAFNGNFSYKNFDLSFLFQGQANAEVMLRFPVGGGDNTAAFAAEDRWTADNPDGKYPRANEISSGENLPPSDFWIWDNSFLRLKNLEFGYSLPENWLERVNIQNIRFYISGFNIHTWTENFVMDPEQNQEDGIGYPQSRVFNFGVNVKL